MSDHRKYLDHAEDADRLARLSATHAERAAYERIATVWRELAGDDDRAADKISARRDGSVRPPRD